VSVHVLRFSSAFYQRSLIDLKSFTKTMRNLLVCFVWKWEYIVIVLSFILVLLQIVKFSTRKLISRVIRGAEGPKLSRCAQAVFSKLFVFNVLLLLYFVLLLVFFLYRLPLLLTVLLSSPLNFCPLSPSFFYSLIFNCLISLCFMASSNFLPLVFRSQHIRV